MKKIFAVMMAIAMMCTLVSCGTGTSGDDTSTADGVITIKADSPFAATHPWSMGLDYLGELLEERTDGAMTVDVYYSNSIGGGSDLTSIEMVQTGAATMCIRSPLVLQSWNQNFLVFSLPFLFHDQETGFAFLESDIGQESLTWLEDNGMTGVGFVVNGYRQLTNSVRPVTSPEDLSGLKIRIPNTETLVETFRVLGADPTILNMSEVYTSVQNGTVDGQENPVAVIDSNRIYEVCPYITLWTYMWDPAYVLCNSEFLNNLTEEQRTIFDEAVSEMCDYTINLLNDQESEQIQGFKDYGCEVVELTEEQNAAFKEATASVYDIARDTVGDELVDQVITTVEAIVAEQ